MSDVVHDPIHDPIHSAVRSDAASAEPGAGWQADVAVVVLAALTQGYVYTVDGVVREVNDAFCAMTGFTREPVSYTHLTLPTNREV